MRDLFRRAAVVAGAAVVLLGQATGVAGATAVVQPLFQLEPSVGVANGSVVAIGTGFAAGQAVTVANQTTGATVCRHVQ